MNSKSILIVEDEATVSEVIRQMLANTGYAVTAAVTNIPDALKEIERQRPDMVLMDIQNHSEMKFTHGICPDCIRKLYPDAAASLEAEERKTAAGG